MIKIYRYNKDKPLTKTLRITLSNIEKSNKNKVRSAIRKYAITQKATITYEQGAFKSYVDSLSISNINMKGLNGVILFEISRR